MLISSVNYVMTTKLTEFEIRNRTEKIRANMFENSVNIKEGNFRSISHSDLYLLFIEYRKYFLPVLDKLLDKKHFSMRLSKRLTKTGGKTSFKQMMHKNTKIGDPQYQIVISSFLLFQSFNNKREVKVNGIVCRDRLDALQRIFEHELIHLLEMLIWKQSSCNKDRFKIIVANIFGHSDVKHDLVTQGEIAMERGIKIGEYVKFEYDGRMHRGIVNRITKRASILVKDTKGKLHKDGNKYITYFIPLHLLIPASKNSKN